MIPQYFIDSSGLKYAQEDIKEPPNAEEIKTAEAWIKLHCRKRKTVNKDHSSYGLKHKAENWGSFLNKHFKTDIFSSYIANGAFIQAAVNLGFMPCQTDKWINANFCMSVHASDYGL